MFTGWYRLPFWSGCGHTHILTPHTIIELHFSGTRLTLPTYHRPKPGWRVRLGPKEQVCEAEFWF